MFIKEFALPFRCDERHRWIAGVCVSLAMTARLPVALIRVAVLFAAWWFPIDIALAYAVLAILVKGGRRREVASSHADAEHVAHDVYRVGDLDDRLRRLEEDLTSSFHDRRADRNERRA